MNDIGSRLLACRNLSRSFTDAGERLEVLRDVSLDVEDGSSMAIVGASGSGKSTLLHLLGGLDRPSGGEVYVRGENISAMSEAGRGRLRNRELGFIYQFHHLLPEFSARENVAMPLLIRGVAAAEAAEKASSILERVGLSDRLDHKPAQLSGGERQRAAVARALVGEPAVVLADEPTGNLDAVNAARIFELLLELKDEAGTSVVVVTHDESLAQRMERVCQLVGGVLQT